MTLHSHPTVTGPVPVPPAIPLPGQPQTPFTPFGGAVQQNPAVIAQQQNPFELLSMIVPRARSGEELAVLAAEVGPPPPADFQPSNAPLNPSVARARLQGLPQTPLQRGGALPNVIPPMTSGEAKTSPSVGELLLGRGGMAPVPQGGGF